ncbi:unnamed protein product [Brachionus calyciflorus]|uniref:MSP domain-containing protein n=1 Tax=Brachionus calyciflorus TaxID=104777 RepID=A0A813RQ97_9BILA|nr:unnamed protein product [Brachionus calyciflorus]
MSWEIKGTVGSLEALPHITYQSKVSAPKNPKLIKEIKSLRKLKPSEFLREMSMDTKQKLASTHEMYLPKIVELLDMGETSLQKNTQLMVDEPMFQPYPSEIFFQKFEPFTTYEIPLLLRNNDKVPRLVKVTQLDTPYFKIITSADAHQKVGPGLPIIYKIQFTPEENKDYNHELIVTTEREKFIVPIRCIGSRAILDFPDEINFYFSESESVCPVRYVKERTLCVRNIGNKDAKFSLKCDEPFSVVPDHGILPIGENMQVNVYFNPQKCGEYKKELSINYDSSETIFAQLYGSAQDVNVRLDKNSIHIGETYITMSNQRTISIHNRSKIRVHFQWKKFATFELEQQQKLKEIMNLNREEENAKIKMSNLTEDYMTLLSRNFQNKIKTTENKSYHFEDEVFFIQPIEGEIWPDCTFECNIIFKPDYAQTYNRIAYCEVTGRESRLPLRLTGIGAGPKVQLSIEKLDIGSVFIGSTHVYEVVLSNKGFIDAIYNIIIPNTQFGKYFSFDPNEGLISPGGFQAITISFNCNKLGDFNETFDFSIDGKPEKYSMTISGTVIPPTFNFDIPKIKYGLVSYGFKYTHQCLLTNTSLVPMSFNLRVASDNEVRDIPESDQDEYNFKEFSLIPSQGIIPPQSDTKILVEFVPHFIKKYETFLIVDIENVGNDLFNLPISARSTVPQISILTPNIDLGRCFIYHSYEKVVQLCNETSLKARYYLLPSRNNDPIKFTSNQAEGVIEPNSVKHVCVSAESLQLGDIQSDLLIKINGSVEQPIKCNFICISQGPVCQILPKELDWGLTTVLQDSPRDITISNESLIEAKFKAYMGKRNSAWRIEPASGIVEPGSEIVLKAICYLIDKTRYDDVIIIDIENANTQKISVRAQGGGSSIVSEPNIGNLIDFGTFFSGGLLKRVFKLTNKSSRQQSLSFLPDVPVSLNRKESKSKNLPNTLFKMNPNRVELNPGETKEICIEGFGEKPQLVEEYFICNSIIGKTSGKDRIMKFKIRCEFVAPLVSFSTRELVFRCEHDGTSIPESQTKYLTISNVSSLDLTAHLTTNSPFSLIEEDTGNLVKELLVNLKTGDSLHVGINYNTQFKQDLHNEISNGLLTISYSEHQHNDLVNLVGEIYFPNVHLETNIIDFECILNNTEVTQIVKMTNIGPLSVNYKWKFILEKDNIVSNLNADQTNHSDNDSENRNLKLDLSALTDENQNQDDTEQNDLAKSQTLIDQSKAKIENKLEELLMKQNELETPSIEEIFNITPLFGSLNPGETQNLTVTYFGHKEIRAYVKAVCEIQNGPDYELMLKGEASVLNYELSTRTIDLGNIPYDEISEAKLTIKNLGRVTIQYSMIGIHTDETSEYVIEPDLPVIVPMKGSIEADKTATLDVKYLPGSPKKFCKTFQLQISHFAPEEILIQGDAGFADIMLDLPRYESENYKILRREAKSAMKTNEHKSEADISALHLAPELDLQVEIDRIAIETFVKNYTADLAQVIPIGNETDSQELYNNTEQKQEEPLTNDVLSSPKASPKLELKQNDNLKSKSAVSTKTIQSSKSQAKKKIKPYLPDYILDFGHVILGTVKTHVVRAANMGKIFASFEIERQNFSKTGFLIDLEKVRNLPNEESVEFVVTFDPRGANLGLGPVEHVIPINIINGPILNLRLKANVTMPDLQISSDIVDFTEVKCGECKIVTVQLNNHKEVRCDWSASYINKKEDKFTPLHKRKKKLEAQENRPKIFEIMPPNGILMPGQKVNIQVKFMPTEEKFYEERVTIRMAQSSQRLMILCKGKGLEPRIELSKNSLEFEPILPHSGGDEQEVKITNPCAYPIEIYNLEFDKNYLEEERILRIIRGYDEYNTILLPPRNVGDKLPIELYDFYEEQQKKLEEEDQKQKQLLNDTINEMENQENVEIKTEVKIDSSNTQQQVGDVEKNPVFDSIARYLGIDLSNEGRAARNRRGVSMVVHGPPLSGKSRAAVGLAKYYECALLTIDSIIIDAIASSTSPAAAKARQFCADAAAKFAEEEKAEMARNLLLAGAQNTALAQPGGLSVEALAQHSITQGGVPGGSKKTSVAGDSHGNFKPSKKVKGDTSNADQSSNHPSTPPPLSGPVARKLSISTNLFSQEDGYMSTVLPEDVIVDILSERFLLSDCNRGIIIDGLDTLFSQNHLLAASAVLKAFNNRRYIYFVILKSDFQKYKEHLNKLNEEKMKLKKEQEMLEKLFIEEMDEETYNSLPLERRQEIDQRFLETKKQRLKKEAEEKAAERGRIEKELAEQQARLEEERQKKKKKTANGKDSDKKSGAPSQNANHLKKDAPKENKEKAESAAKPEKQVQQNGTERPHTRTENIEDTDKTKKPINKAAHEEEPVIKEKMIDPEEEKRKEAEKLLQQRFKTFDLHFKELCNLLEAWDRTQGTVFRQPSPSEKSDPDDHLPKKTIKPQKNKDKDKKDKEKDKEKEKAEAEKLKAEQLQQQLQQQQQHNDENDENQDPNQSLLQNDEKNKEDGVGVPCIIIENVNKSELDEVFKHPKFPLIGEVLDGMGLGPKGPPIPPPASFAVVPYPVYRKAPAGADFSHYIFVTNNENDPNLIPEEKPKQDISIIPEGSAIEGEKTPDNSSSKPGIKSSKQKQGASRNDSRSVEVQRRASGDRKRTESRTLKRESGAQSPNRGSSSLSGNKNDDNMDGTGSIDGSSLEKPSQKLQRFRWILPPNGEITVRLRFTSEETGQFDQTLSFEIVGTRRRYQLHCRGICTFPTISREPRIVFTNRKKNKEPNEIVNKKYLLNEDLFEFGPLLVGNNKDRCREGKFPEYVENLNIQNVSPLEAEVSFCFLDDTNEKADSCFFLEPSEFTLKQNETKQLKVFACPREPKIYSDTLICCVKENPEPVTFKISCHGQKPELILDKKEFNFKQVLLHRKDSKDIKMTNNTLIPVQWRLEGVDLLGEEFVCNQISGIIEPFQTFTLVLHFRALRPLVLSPKDKKILKLLVSSVNSFLGFMENHSILVTAEAYDVALEINLPKGNDGGLEFGNVRVNNESKLNCTLKNKGKYPIKYNFLTESNGPNTSELLKYLTISPAMGELPSVHDRNSQNQIVTVTINPKKEIYVKDASVLKCQITEPTVNDGSIIANIPIKLSVKALVSKFAITPQSEINFGPILNNTRRQERFVIENKGEFDFKFTISKYSVESVKNQSKDGVQNQARLQCGVYTITPAYGILLPQGGHQIITVDCAPDSPGRYEEDLVIDIVDRDMNEYPNGIMYKLVSESVQPGISNTNEIFEEHTIVPNMASFNPKMMGIGIYIEDDNKFFFNNVIVGRTAKARFKLINNNKIPIDLNISLNSKPTNTKSTRLQTQPESAFEIEPSKAQIAPFCHIYAIVSFTPTSMTSYNTYFEASLENPNANIKNKTIHFEINGDGNLPRFTVLKPTLRNKKGQTLMLFKRSILNHTDSQQLVLRNDGNLATKVNFYLIDPDSAFKLRPLENKTAVVFNDKTVSSVVIQPNSQVSFIVSCTPKQVQAYQASLQLTVTDNQFEDTLIQLIGEGYTEDVTIENLHSLPDNEDDEVLSDEDACALKSNQINFGDVYSNEKKQLLFTMRNSSKTDCFRFEWPTGTGLNSPTEQNSNSIIQFSPRVGHLHAGCAKDITISFKSLEPKTLKKELFSCNLSKIIFDQPMNEVKDWDDRMTIIKYINEFVQNSVSTGPVSNSLNEASTLFTQRQMSEANISNSVNQLVNQAQLQQPSNVSQMSNKQIVRKKVVEVEPEPKYTKSDELTQPLELFVNANCDYSRYRCKTSSIRFKDTLMFQTRVYEVSVINRGKTSFDYNWKVTMEDSRRPFTPQIQAETPTPEHSQSPPGRTSKTSKSGTDNSISPTRKSTKELSKDAKKDSGKNSNPKKLSSKDSIDEGKGAKNRKLKESKNSAGDLNDEVQTNRTIDNDNFINTAIQPLRPESPNQIRAESSLSQNAPSSITETGYVPFSIEPMFGKIEPGKTQTFKVKFSPLNVNEYQARIICQIPNTEDGKIGHIIPVKGRGLLPYCHFEVEESDYISSGRRNPDLPGPSGAASGLGLDSMTKVIEFNCVGIGNKILKKFEIINPTNVDYDFEWVKEDQNDGRRHDQFICHTLSGHLPSGRKTEILFEFNPSDIGIDETFWKFQIQKFDLAIPFLLVGISTEPRVIFDKSYISFKPLLLGRPGSEIVYLINQENKKLTFEFDQTSCYTDSRSEVVLVNPAIGELEPNSKFPITLTFTPKEQRKSVFNPKCFVQSSKKPLGLNVKGEGFAIQTALFCEDTNSGNKIEFSDMCINEIHMGEVEKNEICFRNLYIHNQGKYLANFEWYLSSQFTDSLECFTIEPNVGYIEPGDKRHCVLKYQAKHEKSTIANLILKIDNGPVYHVHLDGIAVKPDLQFSFQEFNFGNCFIYKAGMKMNTKALVMTNRGNKDLNVSCLTELNSVFQFDFKQQIIQPGKSLTSLITFIPREVKSYQEILIFELNGLTRREVDIKGQGVQMKVEIVDLKNKLFDIGTLQIGKISKKTLQIINKSSTNINFNLLFEPKSEFLKDKSIIQISPLQNISLKQNQILDLQIKFAPKTRIPKFLEDLFIEYSGIHVPLCSLQGACHGYNIWLETNTVPFGAITQKCSTTKRILMHNDGDIGASFKWETDKMKPEFSIYPQMGYISAGMEIPFDITLNPVELTTDLRKANIKCFIEGNPPLTLTLTGSCVQIIPQKESHVFETNVRQKETKQITITNRTNAQWDLKPVIEGEFFSGLETFIVEPNNSNSYEIAYFPMTMTTNDRKHTGSVFFPLPDGTGLFYNLIGTANSPKPVGKIQREVPCKTPYTEVLTIENWLKKPQRFKVNFEITKPDRPDPSTNIKGNDYIDVPGNGKKEYKLNYLAHKEGVTLLKVIFKNEQTNEYSYYEMGFKAIRASSIGNIDLVTQVRVPISYSLKLENPLQNAVTFSATCSNNSEILIPSNVTISSKSQGDFNFEFLPLKSGESTAKIEITSSELGSSIYDLNLKAIQAPIEKPIYFKTSLGSSQVQTAKFINFCKQKTDYTCKVSSSDFKVDKSIPAAPSAIPSGIEVSFEINYEPTNLVDTKATLTLSSPLGGEYVIPLFGSCLPPKPQGPFVIKSGSSRPIEFKNVFLSPLNFSFAIDNPLFHVAKQSELIKSHQTHKIIVGFDGNDSPSKADVMAKLVITAPKSAGVTNNIQWVYYLKGVSNN